MQDTKLGFVVQALSTIAHALRALYLNECLSLPELATASSSYSYSSSVDVDREEDPRLAERRESAANALLRTRRSTNTTTDTAVEVGRDYEGTRENEEANEKEDEEEEKEKGKEENARAERGQRVKRQRSATASGEESGRRRRAADCPSIVNLSGPRLFSYLMGVNFTLPSGQPIFFDATGDPPARCSLISSRDSFNFLRSLYLFSVQG